jgi:hypothetical protein
MKTKPTKWLPQAQVEKSFQKAVAPLRAIRGFVKLDLSATIRVQDATDPNKAVILQSKHTV